MADPLPHSIEQLVEWIDIIARHGVNLTTWEEQFIESQQSRVEMYGDRVIFSFAQAEHIERIYTDRVPHTIDSGRRYE